MVRPYLSRPVVFTAGLLIVILCTAILLTACSHSSAAGQSSLPSGETITWIPQSPRIGDLVTAEVFIPDSRTLATESVWLTGPDGIQEIPVREQAVSGGRNIFFSFRIRSAGDWLWQTTNADSQTLWTAATEAGDATELKVLDTEWLRTGKGSPEGKATEADTTAAPTANSSPSAPDISSQRDSSSGTAVLPEAEEVPL